MARVISKFLITVFLIGLYALAAGWVRVTRWNHRTRRRELARVTSVFTRICVRLFSIQIEVDGLEHFQGGKRAPLILSNHLSYLDVFLISAVRPSVFVTSVEVRDTPFLGFMAKSGGSLFVERRSKWGLTQELTEISEVLESGIPVVIFPEGTTSNGESILPFKSALLRCAEVAGTSILPACVRYVELDGEQMSEKNRDRLYYYGDIQFFPHFMGLMAVRSIRIKLKFLAPLASGATEGLRRKPLADQIRQSILEAYA